jgi:hypothetical protein
MLFIKAKDNACGNHRRTCKRRDFLEFHAVILQQPGASGFNASFNLFSTPLERPSPFPQTEKAMLPLRYKPGTESHVFPLPLSRHTALVRLLLPSLPAPRTNSVRLPVAVPWISNVSSSYSRGLSRATHPGDLHVSLTQRLPSRAVTSASAKKIFRPHLKHGTWVPFP